MYYLTTGEYRKAIREYEKYHETNSEINFYVEMATAYCHLREIDQAYKCADALMSMGGDSVQEAKELKLAIALENEDGEVAKEKFKVWSGARFGFSLKGISYPGQLRLAKVHVKKKQYKKALVYLDGTDEKFSEACVMKGEILLLEGKLKKALETFEAAKQSWPDDVETYCFLSITHLCLGDKEKSKEEAEQGLRVLKKKIRVGDELKKQYKDLGILHALLGQFEEAERYFEQAEDASLCVDCLRCNCSKVWLMKAYRYHLMNEREKSLEALSEAEKICNDDLDYDLFSKLIREN